jgi:hypothetical protein
MDFLNPTIVDNIVCMSLLIRAQKDVCNIVAIYYKRLIRIKLKSRSRGSIIQRAGSCSLLSAKVEMKNTIATMKSLH